MSDSTQWWRLKSTQFLSGPGWFNRHKAYPGRPFVPPGKRQQMVELFPTLQAFENYDRADSFPVEQRWLEEVSHRPEEG